MEPSRVEPWIEGRSSLYALVRNGGCLVDEFLAVLREVDEDSMLRMKTILEWLAGEVYIRPQYLRPELPELGVFALYNHKGLSGTNYNKARLLCSYAGNCDNILLLGAGFVKSKTEPIQQNGSAHYEARFLARIVKEINERIENGEVRVIGSQLASRNSDALDF